MKGRTQTRIFPIPLGAAGLMGGRRFAYDLHEMLWVWWPWPEGRRTTWRLEGLLFSNTFQREN